MRLPAPEQRGGGGGDAWPPAPQLLGQHRAAGPAAGQRAPRAVPLAGRHPRHAMPAGQCRGSRREGAVGGTRLGWVSPRGAGSGCGTRVGSWHEAGGVPAWHLTSPALVVPCGNWGGMGTAPPLHGCAPVLTHRSGGCLLLLAGETEAQGNGVQQHGSAGPSTAQGWSTVPGAGWCHPVAAWRPAGGPMGYPPHIGCCCGSVGLCVGVLWGVFREHIGVCGGCSCLGV